jgi:hypothetical protein
MDALKYSNYMSAGMGLYSFAGQQEAASTAASSSSPSSSGGQAASTSGQDLSQQMMMMKGGGGGGYTADSLSRSYLEQQKSYYESVGLKGYGGGSGEGNSSNGRSSVGGQPSGGGGGSFDVKSFTPDSSMSGRQSAESPDLKKAEAAALQAYYSGAGMAAAAAGTTAAGLPPLLPMAAAAQLSQYGTTAGSMYPMQASPGTEYSRKPLSVLF